MDVVQRALDAIDDANRDDPGSHRGEPLALLQGRLADAWTRRLDPSASDAVRLAARAHHLRRWVVPRASYPEGRAGYLRWRRDQKTRHAAELTDILRSVGADTELVTRAAAIVAKKGLGTDADVQLFEDAVSLTFVETQLGATADRLDDPRMVEVIAGTLAKMSEAGRAAALTIPLDRRDGELLARAVELHGSGG